MGTKKVEQPSNPQLLISKAEAKSLLLDRIEKGRELLKSNISSFDILEMERNKYFKWDEYNSQLLKNIFSNSSISEDYSYWGLMVSGGVPNLKRDIEEHYDDINTKLTRLESLTDR